MRKKVLSLESEVIPRLREILADRDRDSRIADDYQRAVDDLARMSRLLEDAVRTEDLSADPDVVELGDTVTIELEDGTEERHLIVHPDEAPFHAGISSESPLARELLGRRVGERVAVEAPSGTYRCRIRRTERSAGSSMGRAAGENERRAAAS